MASKKQMETFQIPALNSKLMKVKIKGTSPIIFHKWDEKAIKMILDKQLKKAQKGREVRDPQADFISSFYKNADNQVYIPARNIKQAIVGSARFINGIPMTVLRGTVFVWGESDKQEVLLLNKGKPIVVSGKVKEFAEGESTVENIVGHDEEDANIQMRQDMVTVGMGSADIRFRGQIQEWEAEVMIQYDADILSAEQILNLLQRAGFSQGLGEWRPEKNGSNGTFEVDSTSATPGGA